MSDYPVGATWRAENDHGTTGVIRLRRRSRYFEVWVWSVSYQDGSHPFPGSDWGATRRFVREECAMRLAGMGFSNPRFMRVKEVLDKPDPTEAK